MREALEPRTLEHEPEHDAIVARGSSPLVGLSRIQRTGAKLNIGECIRWAACSSSQGVTCRA